jgi:hypothetical protein
MSEGGTAARGVPVRQIQLQKSVMDGCCSFPKGKPCGKRSANLRLRRRAERRTRGRELKLAVANPEKLLGSETKRGTRSEPAVSKRQHVLFRSRWQSRGRERGSAARAPIDGTRFGSCFSRLLSRKLEKTDLGRSPHNPTATRKRGAGNRREATKRETRRGTRLLGTNNSREQKQDLPRKRSKAS